MFFAAAKELRGEKRRQSNEPEHGITVDTNMDVHVGSPPSSRFPPRKALDIVYPEFASVKLGEILKIVDPTYEEEQVRPAKKLRPTSPVHAQAGDNSAPIEPVSIHPSPKQAGVPKFNSLDDIINSFPELERMIQAQQAKLEAGRVPVEYVREYTKPVEPVKPSLVSSTDSSVFAGLPKVTEDTPVPTGGLATPSEPLPPIEPVGGGLLAGIDDLFGDNKKTKLKSKSRR